MTHKNNEKSNRSNAAGTPFPLVHEHMQKLRYWYQSKLTNAQLAVLLLVWLKNDFKAVTEQQIFPFFYRSKSSNQAESNCLRILREGAVSWVEYSIEIGAGECIWIPIPIALKGFFWRVLQERSYDKPILNEKESLDLFDFWMRKMTRPRADRGIKMAHKTAWANYINNYCQADTVLSSNSKSLYFSKLHHSSADAYQTETIESDRYQLFKSINNSVDRLISEADKWGILPDFERFINGHQIIPNRHEKLAQYLTETHGLISEIKIDYKEHHHEFNKVSTTNVGTKAAVKRADVCDLFYKLSNELFSLKLQAKSRKGFVEYYNQVTYTLALQLILLTNMRPTHKVSPLLASVSDDRFCIKDKGQSRNVLLGSFLQDQINYYQQLKDNIASIFLFSETSPYLLFLIDENSQPTQLTAKKLRLFMNTYWPGHVPYQLRKAHSQMLMELKIPNHLLDRVMGHSNLGEHDGAMTVFPSEEETILEALNKLPEIFKIMAFD